MKPVSDSLRRKIEAMRRTRGNGAEPSWLLNVYRDREKMLGVIEGDRITSGPPSDVEPAVAHASDGRYHAVFERGGILYYMRSSAANNPGITWSQPAALFAGSAPEVDFDGTFSTGGGFTSSDLLLVYESGGTMQFRKLPAGDPANSWSAAVAVGAGTDPALVRGWADPPEVGDQDTGYVVFYTESGDLKYTISTDGGSTWEAPVTVDLPTGGEKREPQASRLADYTLGIAYVYDNSINSEIWFLKTTRTYVNLAAPDETVQVGAGAFRHYEFVVVEISAPDETVVLGAGGFRHGEFADRELPYYGATEPEETATVGAGEFRQVEFTGIAP